MITKLLHFHKRPSLYYLTATSPSPCSILLSHFSTSPPHSRSFASRRDEEESRSVKVSVWWDFENCNLPAGVNVFKVGQLITAAVRAHGIKGPVQITAFGDVLQLSRANQEALSATGINLAHVPNGGKNSADRSLLVDLMYWVSQNPPPAHLFLISGDRDFSAILHRLRMNNYNILLASIDTAPSVLCSAASIMWNWYLLVKGESLTGRVFNQPPDGPYGSWYGHFQELLEDSFPVDNPPSGARIDETLEPSSDPDVCTIPKAVIKQVRNILSSNPKGIPIGDLRQELRRSNVMSDKDLYGYKKFTRFLLAMPDVLSLQPLGDGLFIVHGIKAKAPEPFEPNPCLSRSPIRGDGNQNLTRPSKSKEEDLSLSGPVDEQSSKPVLPEVEDEVSWKVQKSSDHSDEAVKLELDQILKKLEKPLPTDEKLVEVVNTQISENKLPPPDEQESKSEVGMFERIRRLWIGSDYDRSEIKSSEIPKETGSSGVNFENENQKPVQKCGSSHCSSTRNEVVKKCGVSTSQDSVCLESSSSSTQPTTSNNISLSSQISDENSEKKLDVLKRIMNWPTFWRNNPSPDSFGDQTSEALNAADDSSKKLKIFDEEYFWRDVESFIGSQRGSLAISQSMTREEMAQNLQKEGPLVLKSLNQSSILHLVDMLISEKKWIEENLSNTVPFKPTQFVIKSDPFSSSHSSNGLRSIFERKRMQSKSQSLPEQNDSKRVQNVSHSGVSPPVIATKGPSDKSRTRILRDCQKLVKEILKEFPEGYNISSFRKLFLERYGYHLDVQKLGYQKLATLLQIMPGVAVESTFIVPASKSPQNLSQDMITPKFLHNDIAQTTAYSDASSKTGESDSPWDELGPVENAGSLKKEVQSSSVKSVKTAQLQYEPCLSDDDLSDSEGESLAVSPSEKPKIHDENSSLLQILDSWYSSKEGESSNDKVENLEGLVDCSYSNELQSDQSGSDTKSRTSHGISVRKKRPERPYCFISDPDKKETDGVVDGIIGSLSRVKDAELK